MKKLLLILLVLGFVEAESGGIHRRHYRPSGDVVWWEIDALDAPFIFSIDGNYASIGATVVASDNIVYEPLVLTGIWPNSTDGFDPSGGNLTPVFWSVQSAPSTWVAQSYSTGEAATSGGGYWYASEPTDATDVPGVSSKWVNFTTWDAGVNYFLVGVEWTINQDVNVFYKCIIQSGPSTDFGAQNPESPTQFWQVYTWQVHNMGTTYALSDLALKTDFSAWYHSLFNGNIGHAIP